ncbi:hypothetical protein QIV32_05095 [Enterobacter ludwigii]|uniref:hypothetical protein n=1 Tax=Enterobacter ludwigii TaxID=299767 RepID=UPI00234DDFA8|nr:hypothetical protein [Enterobacter ludwigii]MDC7312684.1 hypothetical protein [Enterobacter ludwigii]MDI0402736.1 hypothetical protein [Enterobacter ludwigii]MDI0410629.1 hypothetical protein [Enterobacter ludwigii]MDI0417749.1 hypothetical protein [Enterobacter ludwigii]MDI0427774.1 hypothetical protein [Enterobacter ludwigii]
MKQKFIEWFNKNNNGCSPEMAGDGSFEREKTQHMFVAYQSGMAEGEAKCAALAAENAWLKESRQRLAEFIHEELDADYPLNMDIGTPTTDAFLAEVRASALDEFAKAQDEQAKKYYEMSPGCTAQDECQFAASQAWYFAECIRKGVQS